MFVKSRDASYNGIYMVTPELLDFIRAQFREGISRGDLENILVSQGGWNKDDVNEAFDVVLTPPPPPPPTPPPVPVFIAPTPVVPVVVATPPPQPTPTVEAVRLVEVLPPAQVFVPIVAVMTETPAPVAVVTPQPVFTPPATEVNEPPPLTNYPSLVTREAAAVVHDVDVAVTPSVMPVIAPEVVPVHDVVTPAIEDEKVEDDFLGIFNEPAPSKAAEVQSAVITPNVNADAYVIPPSALESILVSAVSGQGPETGNIAAIPVARQVAIVTPPEAPSAQAPTTPAPTFKFDFSKILTKGDSVQAPVNTTTPPPIIKKEEVIAPFALTPAPDVVATPPVVPTTPVSPKPQSSTFARRTMASDILLRGMGAPIPGMPAIMAPQETTPPNVRPQSPTIDSKHGQPNAPLAEDIQRKNNIKRTLAFVMGGAILLSVISVAAYAYMKFGGPSEQQVVATAFTNFFGVSSFSYKGQGTIDVELTPAKETTLGAMQNGAIKFAFSFGGIAQNSKEGFGNGLHRVKLTGDFRSGNFAWPTDLETDMRLIGSSLYFHILSFPSTSVLDPELFKTYWIKINLPEIAKELALSGLVANEVGYGSFGGQGGENAFNALLQKTTPLGPPQLLPDEAVEGINAQHMKMKANPDNMLLFVTQLYRKYLGKEIVLSEDQRVRLKNALAKIEIEVWVDKKTGLLLKVSIAGNFDDDMFGTHVKGTISSTATLADFNKEVIVTPPTPILTLEELKVRIEGFRGLRESRMRDQEKVDRLTSLTRTINDYAKAKGRHPTTLLELYDAGMLATSTFSISSLSQYVYASYIKEAPLAKSNRCTPKGKVCAYYHIGVTLEDSTNPLLLGDADITLSEVRGSDTNGCNGENELSCFDLFPIIPVKPVSTTSTSANNPKAGAI